MPIVVVKGSQSPGKKKKPSEDEEAVYLQGMDEVLHMKVYKISQPHFFTGVVTTTLIGGDIFHKDEEDNTDLPLRAAPNPDDEKKPGIPTTLQKIRAHKYTTQKQDPKEQKEFMQRVVEDGDKRKKIAAGSSFSDYFTATVPAEETLTWVVKYVSTNDHNLVDEFIRLDERIQQFESSKGNSPRAGNTIAQSQMRTSQKPFEMSDRPARTNKTASLAQQLELLKAQGTEAFLKAIQSSPHEADLVIDKDHAPQILAGTQPFSSVAFSPHAAEPASTNKSSNKPVPLAPKRPIEEKGRGSATRSSIIKTPASTTAILNSIATAATSVIAASAASPAVQPAVPTKPVHNSSSVRPPSLATVGRTHSFNAGQVSSNETPRSGTEVDSTSASNSPRPDSPPLRSRLASQTSNDSVDSFSNTPIFPSLNIDGIEEGAEGVSEAQDSEVPPPVTSPTLPKKKSSIASGGKKAAVVRPTEPVPSKRSVAGGRRVVIVTTQNNAVDPGGPASDDALMTDSPTNESPSKGSNKRKKKQSGKQVATNVKYGNHLRNPLLGDSFNAVGKESTEASGNGGDGSQNNTREAIEAFKKSQQLMRRSMGMALAVFEKATEKQNQLQTITQNRMLKAQRAGQRLFSRFAGFEESRKDALSTAEHLWEEKSHLRSAALAAKMRFVCDDDRFGGVGGQMYKDLRKMRHKAQQWTEEQELKALTSSVNRWFVQCVQRLREYMRRMNNIVPPCAIKFVFALQLLLRLYATALENNSQGLAVTAQVFCSILLSPIFSKDDFRKPIVQQLLEVVREGLGLSIEEFVQFLELNDLPVPAEMLNQLRSIGKERSARARSRERRDTALRGSQQFSPSSRTGLLGSDASTPVFTPALSSSPVSPKGASPPMFSEAETLLLSNPVGTFQPKPIISSISSVAVNEIALDPEGGGVAKREAQLAEDN